MRATKWSKAIDRRAIVVRSWRVEMAGCRALLHADFGGQSMNEWRRQWSVFSDKVTISYVGVDGWRKDKRWLLSEEVSIPITIICYSIKEEAVRWIETWSWLSVSLNIYIGVVASFKEWGCDVNTIHCSKSPSNGWNRRCINSVNYSHLEFAHCPEIDPSQWQLIITYANHTNTHLITKPSPPPMFKCSFVIKAARRRVESESSGTDDGHTETWLEVTCCCAYLFIHTKIILMSTSCV